MTTVFEAGAPCAQEKLIHKSKKIDANKLRRSFIPSPKEKRELSLGGVPYSFRDGNGKLFEFAT